MTDTESAPPVRVRDTVAMHRAKKLQQAFEQRFPFARTLVTADDKYGSSASQRNPSRASTINKIVVGQPIGLQIVAQNLTSQAAKNIKFKG